MQQQRMEPYSNSKEWKEFRHQTEVTLQLDEKVESSFFNKPNMTQGAQNSEDLSDDDAEGKPKCNMWKGQNYDLHVLGSFENEFRKKVKTFQVPPTVSISLDPFCRVEFPTDDPPTGEAYLIWKGKEVPVRSPSLTKDSTTQGQTSELFEVRTSEEEDEDLEDAVFADDDVESDTDPEISQYIKSQKQKKKQGMSLTGETLWYDDDNNSIRNLHAESVSLTTYGNLPDDRNFGNTRLLFDQLLSHEQLMLRPVNSKLIEVHLQKEKVGNPSLLDGGGDYIDEVII